MAGWSRATRFRIGGGLAALAVMLFVLGGLDEVRHDLAVTRYEAGCEHGDMEACGRLAQALLQRGTSMEDLERGMTLMSDLCAQENHAACRFAAYMHAPTYHNQLQDSRGFVYDALVENAVEKCREHDERGCFVASMYVDRLTDVAPLVAASREACKEKKPWGCQALVAVSMARDITVGGDDVTHVRDTCDAGMVGTCVVHSRTENLGAAERLAWVEKACAGDRSSSVCLTRPFLLRETGADEGRVQTAALQACHDGHFDACEWVKIPEGAPHAGVLRRLYEVMGRSSVEPYETVHAEYGYYHWDPTLRALTLAAIPGAEDACADGEPMACFAVGLAMISASQAEVTPRLPLYESLESTLGVACDAGVNAACVLLGNTLIDRPYGEKRHLREANAWLEKACARNHRAACGMKDFHADLVRGELEGWRSTAETLCAASPESDRPICRELAGIWAHDIGAIPWVFSDRVGYARLRQTCERWGSRRTCVWAGNMLATENDGLGRFQTLPPWHVAGRTLNTKLCLSGESYPWVCERALWHLGLAPFVSNEEESALRTQICAAHPENCP